MDRAGLPWPLASLQQSPSKAHQRQSLQDEKRLNREYTSSAAGSVEKGPRPVVPIQMRMAAMIDSDMLAPPAPNRNAARRTSGSGNTSEIAGKADIGQNW